MRETRTKAEARDELREMCASFDRSNGREFDARRFTFNRLADYYTAHYLKPAVYKDGRKIDGLRSVETSKFLVSRLRSFFGDKLIHDITYHDLRLFRESRFAVPTAHDIAKFGRAKAKDETLTLVSTRSVASVNRELTCLRRMLNIACMEGWLARNPFHLGKSLISAADERKRTRTLSPTEETRLLAACATPKRAHLADIIVCALDTGMRRGEILTLKWMDVDLETGIIQIQATNTKTLTAREVKVTTRLLERLKQAHVRREHSRNPELAFGTKDIKCVFERARGEAALDDLRFHDLRHTAGTRLVRQGIQLAEVARILGHTDIKMTYAYVNADAGTIARAATALDDFHRMQAHQASSQVNDTNERQASAFVN